MTDVSTSSAAPGSLPSEEAFREEFAVYFTFLEELRLANGRVLFHLRKM